MTASTWESVTRFKDIGRITGRIAGLGAASSLVFIIGFTAGAAEGKPYGRYLAKAEFLQQAFGRSRPEMRTLWITRQHREPLERLLGHAFGSLRLRYWQHDKRTAWILDEIGKELPITIGIAIEDDAIRMLRILEFREIRGWEVRYPFFTDQFQGAAMTSGGNLDADIDGITGATLSVGAVTRVAEAALYLHGQVAGQR